MSLLRTMREDADPRFWARGVRLAGQDSVFLDRKDNEEVVLRVRIRGVAVPFTVHLWPDDEDWSCDCETDQDVCAHAAAAVLAWEAARERGQPLPGLAADPAQDPGRRPRTVGYRFRRDRRGLFCDRVLVQGKTEAPLEGSLLGRAQTGASAILSRDHDVEAEQAIGGRFGVLVAKERVPRLFRALEQAADVRLDGEPQKVSGDAVLPIARIEDDPATSNTDGFRVRVVRDPGIEEVFRNGCVLCGGILRPVGNGGLSPRQRQVFYQRSGVCFRPDEVEKLVGEVLPALRARIPVDVRTSRLPSEEREPPRLILETRQDGESLVVRPVIVYGDPPFARVERGDLKVTGGRVPMRDRRAELRLRQRVHEELSLPLDLDRTFHAAGAVRFVDRLDRFKGEVKGDAWRRFRRVEAFAPSITVDGDRLDVDFAGADPHRVVAAWREGAELMQTPDGWAPLPSEWLAEHGQLVADLLAARDEESGTVARYALFDLARLAKELDQPPPPGLDSLRALVDGFEGIPEAALPPDLNATLRDYQRTGVDWLGFLREAGMGGVLADDMGLGKTLQALCAVKKGARTLVVAPTSVLHNWVDEAQKFRPSLRVCVYHGPGRVLDEQADLLLTTYGILRLDIETLRETEWDMVVLDEAQAIKNPSSQVARAAFRVRAKHRLTLTGTPVENRLEELWSQIHFTNPGLLGGRRDFRDRYERPIANGEPGVAKHLRARIAPFVLRRLKRDVAKELPPRTDMVLRCTLSTEERAVYDAVRAATKERIVAELGRGQGVLAALEALLRLRQASCHAGLVPGQTAEHSSKVKLLVDTLDSVVSEGHKALVFSQWTSLLDRIQPHLKQAGLDYVRLDGSTRDRGSVVERFQDEAGPPVFLISLKAGGTGLNLTAADHVFLVDPWWNPAVEDQAADRAHRIGQDKPVMVYRLVAEDTVEERILKLQVRKRRLAEAALGEADRASSITRDELMALLD